MILDHCRGCGSLDMFLLFIARHDPNVHDVDLWLLVDLVEAAPMQVVALERARSLATVLGIKGVLVIGPFYSADEGRELFEQRKG